MTSMSTRLPARRVPAWAWLLAFVMSMSFASAVWGTPCDQSIFQPVPDCVPQQQAPVHFDDSETQYWDYYCTGTHPYFWGLSSGYMKNFTWDSWCFSAIENVFGENFPSKFSGLFTNWCTGHDITVTLGCSSQPPPGFAPACNFVGDPVDDPGCPQSNIQNHCASGFPICFQTATETCGNGDRYFCTGDVGLVWCYKCAQ
jgi:hypothetical protein